MTTEKSLVIHQVIYRDSEIWNSAIQLWDGSGSCDDNSFCLSGSNVAYDDSMNLRNILWLAPLPSNSSKGWVAPGMSPNPHLTQQIAMFIKPQTRISLNPLYICCLILVMLMARLYWHLVSVLCPRELQPC